MQKILLTQSIKQMLQKMQLIMKLTFILLLIGTICLKANTGYAQDSQVNLHLENASLTDVFREIEKQSDYRFFYNNAVVVNTDKTFDLNTDNESIADLLNEMFLGTNINYKMVENYIVITHKNDNNAETFLTKSIAQEDITITGTVTDNGESLPGVTVLVKGTNIGIMTDVNGKYRINAPNAGSVLVFSFMGYITTEVEVGAQREINIALVEDVKQLEEVMVIGYGTMKKSDLTGSVVSIKMADKEIAANVNLSQALQGYVAGVNVGGAGRAGVAGAISIRGQTTFSASTEPLIVLDGIIYNGSITDIDVSDVEKIDILKDASAAAVFGSRSANGVIIITTKKGQNEKPLFNFNMYYGFQSMAPSPQTKVMNGDEYAIRLVDYNYYLRELLPWYRTNPTGEAGRPPRPDVTDRELVSRSLRSVEEQENYLAGREINWFDKVYSTTPIQNYSLSVSGKTNLTNYYISGSYIRQDGIMLGDDFNRFTLRTSFENKITNWFTAGLNMSLSRLDYSGYNMSNADVLRASPLANERDDKGNYPTTLANESFMPHPLVNQYVEDVEITNRVFYIISGKIDVPFIKGLSYDLNYSNSFFNRKRDNFYPTITLMGAINNNYARKVRYEGSEWLINNIVSYSRTFNTVHSINGTLLYSAEKRTGENPAISAISYGFQNPILGFNSLELGETQSVTSEAWEESSISYMARLNYAYDSKYLFTATYRRDGFSGFGKNNKYADFPSVSAAWVLSRENFLSEADWLDQLKIRLSYGLNGNQGIGRYASLSTMSSDAYVFGANTAVGVYPTTMGNSELRWESTASTNLGLDVMVFNNRISAEIDMYNANTSDVLVRRNIPQVTGYSSVWANLGGVNNKGIEISLNTRNIVTRDFKWDSRILFSLNRNKITDLYGDGTEQDISNSWFIGEPIGTFYNYVVEGIWQEADLFNGTIYPNYYPGMYKIKSLDDTNVINANKDRTVVGHSVPNYRFGINNNFFYKGIALSFFINSIQGGNGYYMGNVSGIIVPGNSDLEVRANRPAIYPYWRPDNPVNNVPAMYYSPPVTPGIYMSRSFVRLQDVSLSYNIGKSLLEKIGINSLQVYVSGKNLYIWTDWPGWDPEDNDQPLMRSIIGGIRMSF